MHILHYTLGLPPYRSGGLTKYSTDLMCAQIENGDTVSLLYSNGNSFFPQFHDFRQEANNKRIHVYRFKCPLSIPLLSGVKNPLALMNRKLNITNVKKFLRKIKPDVFHIHTLMGLPIEILEVAKQEHIRIVFSAHDYYGLCLRVNFIDCDNNICNTPSGGNCSICNRHAPPNFFLRLRNEKAFSFLKDYFRGINFQSEPKLKNIGNENLEKKRNEYQALLNYYRKFYTLIDFIHFNSSVTRSVYSSFIDVTNSDILPITHKDIRDQRAIKTIDPLNIRLGFIGLLSAYKGFPLLRTLLLNLYKSGIRNWTLSVWCGFEIKDKDCEQIIYLRRFSFDKIFNIYNNIDLLIVPSICKETFGLVSLEALSFGVPVLVSDNVGAKDIVCGFNNNFIYSSEDDLKQKLSLILSNKQILVDYNRAICNKAFPYMLHEHTARLSQKFYF